MAVNKLNWNEKPPDCCRHGAVAIGNFDGVHRGHASLLAELRQQARDVSGPAVVLTFDPHPLQLLRPEQFMPVLTTVADRAELLLRNGADEVLILQTTPQLLQLSAADFFEQVVRRQLDARALVEGVNFGFGRNREGTVETLRELCERHGIGLAVVPPLAVEGVIVSSSRVRGALERGAVREAEGLLGRPYRLRGCVGVGQRRGQKLGFPTANLEQVKTLVPGDGVYAARALEEGNLWPAAANVGPNPTFGEQIRKVEVHLIEFQGDLYGRPLAVDFLERLRDTRPFASAAELVEQLKMDVEQAGRLARVG
jgi:riboflavin kinase/FMN adenylyltransferase